MKEATARMGPTFPGFFLLRDQTVQLEAVEKVELRKSWTAARKAQSPESSGGNFVGSHKLLSHEK